MYIHMNLVRSYTLCKSTVDQSGKLLDYNANYDSPSSLITKFHHHMQICIKILCKNYFAYEYQCSRIASKSCIVLHTSKAVRKFCTYFVILQNVSKYFAKVLQDSCTQLKLHQNPMQMFVWYYIYKVCKIASKFCASVVFYIF